MTFRATQKVLFKHCDPAGIVFYPRYFEIMNDCVEAFFDRIGFPFEVLHLGQAVPTVTIQADFARPSRHGDVLELLLEVARVGRSSLDLTILARAAEEVRMTFRATLVLVDRAGRPTPWPLDMRSALGSHLAKEA